MELPLVASSKIEHRAVIRYFTVQGETTSQIHQKIVEVYSATVSYDIFKRWRRAFLLSRTDLSDEECSVRSRGFDQHCTSIN